MATKSLTMTNTATLSCRIRKRALHVYSPGVVLVARGTLIAAPVSFCLLLLLRPLSLAISDAYRRIGNGGKGICSQNSGQNIVRTNVV